MQLPDPRRYGNGDTHTLAQLAALDDPALAAAVERTVASGQDAELAAAYAAAPSREAYRRLWNAAAAAVEAEPAEAAVVTRVFAMPWLLICGTRTAARLSGVLPDSQVLVAVLEASGALGANRNVGFSNALCDLETLEAVTPATLRAWASGGQAADLPPAPIELAPGDETVHLRFLVGAAVSSPHAAGIADSATNVAAWGMKATAEMSAQLAAPGVDVLPIPRPPMSVPKAAYSGRRTGLEAAFNLFLSNTLRRIRMKVGDPTLVVSAHEGGELRATLYTPLDEGLTEGFRWPLHPLDDLAEIAGTLESFARDCRVLDVVALPTVLPDTTSTGALFFPTAPASAH